MLSCMKALRQSETIAHVTSLHRCCGCTVQESTWLYYRRRQDLCFCVSQRNVIEKENYSYNSTHTVHGKTCPACRSADLKLVLLVSRPDFQVTPSFRLIMCNSTFKLILHSTTFNVHHITVVIDAPFWASPIWLLSLAVWLINFSPSFHHLSSLHCLQISTSLSIFASLIWKGLFTGYWAVFQSAATQSFSCTIVMHNASNICQMINNSGPEGQKRYNIQLGRCNQ